MSRTYHPASEIPIAPNRVGPREARGGRTLVQLAGGVSLVAFLVVVLALGWRSFTTLGSTGPTALGSSGDSSTARSPGPATAATGLEPGLVAAFEEVRDAASDAGRTLTITSGYRTAERQQELLDEAVRDYGSKQEALRWVFSPDRSMHVRGLAVDVGDGPAADWLEANGAAFGLCRTLEWEWWHFEWRAAWQQSGACPRPFTDPADVPTMVFSS